MLRVWTVSSGCRQGLLDGLDGDSEERVSM